MDYQDGVVCCRFEPHMEQAEKARQYLSVHAPLHTECQHAQDVYCTTCNYAKNIDLIYNTNTNYVGSIALLFYNFTDKPLNMSEPKSAYRYLPL